MAKQDNDGKKGGQQSPFSKFYKKENPREEMKAINREEKRRKEASKEERLQEAKKRGPGSGNATGRNTSSQDEGRGARTYGRRHEEMRFDSKQGRYRKDKSPEGLRKKAERTLAADLSEPIRLNRYIALSGVCSRREADELISAGLVSVNGEVTKELGLKVTNGKDIVVCNGKTLEIKNFVYLLMNKPKNMLTTTEADEQGRQTVMDLVHRYTSVRVYPVGRLDRNTTGILLFTNDGNLAKKLTNPNTEMERIYHAKLDKPMDEDHLVALRLGIELEDGPAKADEIEYVDGGARFEVGLNVRSSRNRVVRRMFEHFGYEVLTLDRVKWGPFDKKGLPRGTCRLLTEAEVGFLMMIR